MMATKPADRYFEACFAEHDLDNAVLQCCGIDPDSSPAETPWPFTDIVYDWYDTSFELWGCKDDWAPTADQFAALLSLGFSRGWVCYPDGTERYNLGPRKPSPGPRDSRTKYLLAKRDFEIVRLKEAAASLNR